MSDGANQTVGRLSLSSWSEAVQRTNIVVGGPGSNSLGQVHVVSDGSVPLDRSLPERWLSKIQMISEQAVPAGNLRAHRGFGVLPSDQAIRLLGEQASLSLRCAAEMKGVSLFYPF